jgi:hypothetical protein
MTILRAVQKCSGRPMDPITKYEPAKALTMEIII